nr:hypothetical protein [Tanacetum cinerariifolium]
MLVQQGEGSGTPTKPHHTPSPKAQSDSGFIADQDRETIDKSSTLPHNLAPRVTSPAASSVPSTVADEPASPLRDVSQGEACPTDSGFIADQDRATIDKSSTLPHDLAPRVTSPAAVEGSMQQTIPELTALCTSLQRQLSELTAKFQAQELEINRLKERVKLLEDREGVAIIRSGDDAPIKGRSMDEGEAATERISDDSVEMATVLTSMDAATVLASRVVDVPTGSGSIPTASTPAEEQFPTGSGSIPTASTPAEEQFPTGSDVVPTASLVFATATVVTPYRRRKCKEVMSQQRKPWTKKQKRDYYMAVIRKNLGWKVKDFRGMTFKEVEAKFNSVWKQLEDFVPMCPQVLESTEKANDQKAEEGVLYGCDQKQLGVEVQRFQ